jgi:hypothetical protein
MTRRRIYALISMVMLLSALMALPISSVAASEADCTVWGTKGDDHWATRATFENYPIIPANSIVCGGDGADSIEGHTAFSGTFYGGKGGDFVEELSGTFHGGQGDDTVAAQFGGSFYGGRGDDWALAACSGLFDGGKDSDRVANFYGSATLVGVEVNTGGSVQWCQ